MDKEAKSIILDSHDSVLTIDQVAEILKRVTEQLGVEIDVIVRLGRHDVVRHGDLVTVGKTESTGFREYTGMLGIRVGEFGYPLYRRVGGVE